MVSFAREPRSLRPAHQTCALVAAAVLVVVPLVAPRASAQQPSAAPPAAAVAPSASPEQALRTLLAGRYVPVPGASNAANRDAGVQRTVDSLLFLIRPIASGRLVEANPIWPSVSITFANGIIEVLMPPLVARSPDTGAEGSMISLARERNRLTQRLTHDALVQRSWTDEGSRTTRYVPGGNGRLILQVELASPRLPVPVRYTMAYQRN